MPFPADPNWTETLAFLERHLAPLTPVLAPNDFLHYFPGTYPYQVTIALPAAHFEVAVLHKSMLREIPPAFLRDVLREFMPVFANGVFVVYSRRAPEAAPQLLRTYVKPVERHLAAVEARALRRARRGTQRSSRHTIVRTASHGRCRKCWRSRFRR